MGLPPAAFNDTFRTIVPGNYNNSAIVHIVIPKMGGNSGIDFYRFGISQKISYSVNGMYAHIGQGAAPGKIVLGKPSLWPPIFMDTIAFGLDDLSNLARFDTFLNVLRIHIESPHMTHHDRTSVLFRNFCKLHSLLCVHGHGFLYKNILSVFK